MDLIILVLGLVLIGFLAWLLTTKVPMNPVFATAIQVIVVVVVVLYLLRFFNVPNVLPGR